MAYIPETGSVVAFQSDPTKLVGTVSVIGSLSPSSVMVLNPVSILAVSQSGVWTPSVSGTVGASIIGVGHNSGYLFSGLRAGSKAYDDNNSNTRSTFQGADGTETVMEVRPTVFNGSNWDRVRGNSSVGTLVSTHNTSVISVGQGSVAVAIVSGSIAATFTPPANQSVSGTVHIDNLSSIVSYQLAGSLLAVSGSFSPAGNQSVSGTVHIDNFSSVISYQLAGSILATSATVNPAANQSVSGTVDIGIQSGSIASHIKSGSVVAVLGGNTSVLAIQSGTRATSISGIVDIAGSVFGIVRSSITGGVFPISGSVAATITNNVTVVSSIAGGIFPISGSVAAVVTNFPTSQNINGSVIAQVASSVLTVISGNVPTTQLAGSVMAVSGSFAPAANQSVSGTVGASVIGHAPVVIVGGSILTSSTPNQSVSGTVHIDNFSSVISYQLAGSVLATSATLTPPANQSVSGTIDIGINSGSIVAFQGTPEWTVKSSIAGGIFPISGSVAAVVTNFPTSQNVNGSVIAQIASSVLTVTSGTVVATQIAASIMAVAGTVTANQGTGFGSIATHIKSGSVIAVLGGNTSVVALQGAGWSGSVAGVQTGTWRPSVLNYTTRNDAISSFLGADLTYRPQASDSAGRTLTKPFAAEEARIEGYIALTSTSLTTLVAAGGAGIRNYVTDAWFANTGSVSTLITLSDSGGSILGYTIAPAGGGSNLNGLNVPIRTGDNATFNIQAGSPTSTLYGTVKGFKAP